MKNENNVHKKCSYSRTEGAIGMSSQVTPDEEKIEEVKLNKRDC